MVAASTHDGIRPPLLCMGATGYRDPPLLGRRSTSTTAPRQCLVPRIPPFIDMDSCYSTPWCHAGRVLRGPPSPPSMVSYSQRTMASPGTDAWAAVLADVLQCRLQA
ncbi:uncharacterized protein LOC119304380 [Triticum dicoccoides]|uniref:uncharacterized protein LOC119304380 n=1 Tax=Triticum dicoccoides TaxID=85692 RepID=UPI00188E204C|nr:uncharacterized protein LOC119304380 [Triticum dicoccoides]